MAMQIFELVEIVIGDRRVMVRADEAEQKRAEIAAKMGVDLAEPVAEEPVARGNEPEVDEPEVVRKRRGRK